MEAGADTDAGRVIYIVASHRDPPQVDRLVRRLAESRRTRVVVNHDPNGERLPASLSEIERVEVLDRPLRAPWGTIGSVEVAINAIRHVADELLSEDRVVYLSGQDYPLHHGQTIAARLLASPADAHLSSLRLPEEDPWHNGEGQSRYYYRYFEPRPRRVAGWLHRRFSHRLSDPEGRRTGSDPYRAPRRVVVHNWVGTIHIGVRPRRSPFSSGFPCRVGDAWWTLSGRAARALLEEYDARVSTVRHFRRTLNPDEAVVPTLLGSRADLEIQPLYDRFVLWQGGPSPGILTLAHLPMLRASQALFARKVHIDQSRSLMDALDREAVLA